MVFNGIPFTGALAGAPFPWTWNGSLWTLRYELVCYVVIGVAFLLPRLKFKPIFFSLCLGGITAYSFLSDLLDFGGLLGDAAFLLPFFVAGACLFQYSHLVPLSGKLAAAAAVVLVTILVLGLGRSLVAIPFTYLCLWGGIALPAVFQRVGRHNDFSYGLYLYGFPVQQMLVLLGLEKFGLPWFIMLSLLATIPIAAVSWFLIERPSMGLKGLVSSWPKKVRV